MLSTNRSRSASSMHVADQGAGLAPVVVLGPQGVSGAHHFAVGVPARGLAVAFGVGMRTALGVRRVHRVGGQLVAHVAGGVVAVHRRLGALTGSWL